MSRNRCAGTSDASMIRLLASRSGEPGKAVELLGPSVHEVAYDELGEVAGRIWLALAPEARDRTLLLAPTHALRAEINGTVSPSQTSGEGIRSVGP